MVFSLDLEVSDAGTFYQSAGKEMAGWLTERRNPDEHGELYLVVYVLAHFQLPGQWQPA